MKTIYFDTETTGTNQYKHGIIQIAAILYDGENIIDKVSLTMCPKEGTEYDPKALEVHGYTEDMIKTFTPQTTSFNHFIKFLDMNIDKFDKNDKLTPSGYNVGFDIGMLQQWFYINGNKFYGSYFNYYDSDTFSFVKFLRQNGKIPDNLPSYSLGSIYEFIFGVPLENAHDALIDIEATIKLHKELVTRYLK